LTPRSNNEFEHGSPAQTFDGASDGGLGNLADELGDVWSEDDEGAEGEYAEDIEPQEGVSKIGMALDHDGSVSLENGTPVSVNGVRDSGVVMEESSPETGSKTGGSKTGSKTTLSPQAARQNGKRHQRARSLYDGSDYGDDSDLEGNEGISAGLESRMAAVESLARRGLEENGSPSDQAVQRVVERLKDLGSQTSIENGATRYVQPEPLISHEPNSIPRRLKTTHDALTSHLTHQSRQLTSLTSSLSGPRAVLPSPTDIDELIPLITTTLELLPYSSPDPLYSMSQLTLSTRELLQHLSNVSDSLHMSRQAQANAARRLKSSKEQLGEWKREQEMRERGVAWVENGQWDRKLKEREAKRECGSVVDGFEEVCGMWRKRLCEGLGVASA
jgi:hypothetical protein